MDMGFDQTGFAAAARQTGFALDGDRLEWAGLHARLAAAWQARRAIVALGGSASERLGSFDTRAAATLTTRESAAANASHAVNPSGLADGKVPQGIAADVAGPATVGDRG